MDPAIGSHIVIFQYRIVIGEIGNALIQISSVAIFNSKSVIRRLNWFAFSTVWLTHYLDFSKMLSLGQFCWHWVLHSLHPKENSSSRTFIIKSPISGVISSARVLYSSFFRKRLPCLLILWMNSKIKNGRYFIVSLSRRID